MLHCRHKRTRTIRSTRTIVYISRERNSIEGRDLDRISARTRVYTVPPVASVYLFNRRDVTQTIQVSTCFLTVYLMITVFA